MSNTKPNPDQIAKAIELLRTVDQIALPVPPIGTFYCPINESVVVALGSKDFDKIDYPIGLDPTATSLINDAIWYGIYNRMYDAFTRNGACKGKDGKEPTLAEREAHENARQAASKIVADGYIDRSYIPGMGKAMSTYSIVMAERLAPHYIAQFGPMLNKDNKAIKGDAAIAKAIQAIKKYPSLRDCFVAICGVVVSKPEHVKAGTTVDQLMGDETSGNWFNLQAAAIEESAQRDLATKRALEAAEATDMTASAMFAVS